MLYTILVVVLIIFLIGSLPHWGATPAGWGYWPSGGVGLVVLVLLILLLMGRL